MFVAMTCPPCFRVPSGQHVCSNDMPAVLPSPHRDGMFAAMTCPVFPRHGTSATPDMPSLQNSERGRILLCYKYAVPTGLGNTGMPLLQICRPYGTREHGGMSYATNMPSPTGLGNTGMPLLQICRPLRDSGTRACHCYKYAVPTGLFRHALIYSALVKTYLVGQ